MANLPQKQYVAESTATGVQVLIHLSDADGDTSPLPGDGFEWGYEGGGPSKLAHAILANVVADRFYQDFMKDVIATTSPIENHEKVVVFKESDILAWLKEQLNKMKLGDG